MSQVPKIIIIIFCILFSLNAQTVLEADGPGGTYELINSVLAPAGDVVEHPECIHPGFGRHVAEVWDNELNKYVFEFYIHVTPDNDRCINTDRQRMEIKTYDASPKNLKGTLGETIIYKWKFRLPVGFQPSSKFTHIHQIKAVGGDDGMPIFTLTPRKGSPNKLELIHDNTTKLEVVDLSQFIGVWVECTEKITVGSGGKYSISIKRVSDGLELMTHAENSIMTIRPDNDFIRPKWGIYRSLENASELRDEAVRFSGFSIEEVLTGIDKSEKSKEKKNNLGQNYPNPFNPETTVEFSIDKKEKLSIKLFSQLGEEVAVICNGEYNPGSYLVKINSEKLISGVYFYKLETEHLSEIKKMIVIK